MGFSKMTHGLFLPRFWLLIMIVFTKSCWSQDGRIYLSIPEGEPPYAFVGQISTETGYSYRFLEDTEFFVLDSITGDIHTAQELDRESLDSDKIDLVVLGTSSSSSTGILLLEVTITIDDINDNSPQFPQPFAEIYFLESANIGSSVILDTASDEDIGINDITTDYSIIGEEELFELVVTTNPSGDAFLHIQTTGNLDREIDDFYKLNISARDDGTPSKFGYMILDIIVRDTNDNAPIFNESNYQLSIREGVIIGTYILTVFAYDGDEGINAEINYFITEGVDYFTIDKITGIVRTTKLLTNSNIIEHSLTVEARDMGIPTLSGRAFITITLLDENDHCPVVIFQYTSGTEYAIVDENAPNDFTFALVTVTDADEGDNGISDLTIHSGNEQDHFQLVFQSEVYLVQVAAELDRERISEYNITLIAEDHGSPPCTSTYFLVIYVDDVNDHIPEFEHLDYYSVLSESVPPGSFVQGVTATDEDSGINALVYYTISEGNENGWFYIDKDTGLVTTVEVLDRELASNQILSLIAYNEGNPDYFAASYLYINITDENDEKPLFTRDNYNISVVENQITNPIDTIQALDSDEGINGTVFYKFNDVTLSVFGNLFSIDLDSGLLSILQILDYEETKEYSLIVIAFDGGNPSLESSVEVTLQIVDINDNFPVFYPVLYIADIFENSPAGTFVAQVTASDADSGNWGTVYYKTISDSSDGNFLINSTTGIIATSQVLDREEQAKYTLGLIAVDGGGKEASASAFVEINVINIQDIPPVFSQLGYSFTIYENIEIDSEVGIVDAVSNDSDNVTYLIFMGDSSNIFHIDPTTGKIATIKPVDREELSFYNLVIIANGGQVTSQVQVNITILDLNDNSPSFHKLFDSADIVEDWSTGHEVYQAQALDADSGPNARVFYELTINPDNNFWINETSGILYLLNIVVYTSTNQFLVQIKAFDSGTPQLSSFFNLTIYVRDVNNHPPLFSEISYTVDISELTSVNEQFYTLEANDEDIGENGEVLYYILSGNDGTVFGIFPNGNMYVKNTLDREIKDFYELIVVAADKGIPQYTSSVSLIINLLDENDNRPLFESTSYTFFLDEESPAGTTIGTLLANDPDLGKNSELFYEFITNQTNFIISNVLGIITSLSQFDRELGFQEFTLDAIVKDNGITPLNDLTHITIYISDINDNIPLFSQDIYKAVVSESAINGTPVLQVVATDADLEENGYIVYSIIDGNTEGYFDISLTSGQIKLINQLDREIQDYYEFTVKAQDNGKNMLSSLAQVLIQIADENDNEPEFLQSIYTVSISETAQIGYTIITVSATDKDSAGNSLISYAITKGNEHFIFGINSDSGEIYLTGMLDFEFQSDIVLEVTAYDSGIPQLFNSTQIKITVFDSNDNKPMFSQSPIVAKITEGVQIGTPVLQVTATDPDSGLNGEVEYSIISQSPSGFNFFINNDTGDIYTADEIDREALLDGYFEIVVRATDKAPTVSERKWSSLLVTLVVNDINDNAPIFISQLAFLVSEFINIGEEVALVLAEDADINSNGEIVYSLENNWFEIDANSGVITLTEHLDVPPLLYSITVTATDNGENRLKTNFNLTIIIADNDLNIGPIFSMDIYSANISEDVEVGTSILQVHAENSDEDSSHILYFITSTSITLGSILFGNHFIIDSESGIITTAKLLDKETGFETFLLEIYAVDINSSEPRTTFIQAIINLLDVNDNIPIFQLDTYLVTISENTEIGVLVETVKAIDNDFENNAIISYSIYSGNDANSFDINSETGEIFTRGNLDRELIPLFNLEIHASDSIGFSSTIVRIEIIDVNDNVPAFTYGIYSFEAREDLEIGNKVAEILATDPDSDSNGAITYMFDSADYVKNILFLDPESGVFTLIDELDFEQDKHFIITVTAIDGGFPSQNSSALMYFNILDVNDNLPIFENDRYNVEVFENIDISTTILQLFASDIDSGMNSELVYMITGGDICGQFTVLNDGSLINIQLLDREEISFYNLEITVTDQALLAEEQLSSIAEVSIILKDINDNAPIFTSSLIASVSEAAIVGTIIMEVNAIDEDLGDNSYLEYLPLSNFGEIFNLGQDGYLRVFGNLDREKIPNYTLSITVNDKGQPLLSSTIDLVVLITDENDNFPKSEFLQYEINLSENIPIGTEFLQIIAVDDDEELNGYIFYSILDGNYDSDFYINPSNGKISVFKRLDFERRPLYSLTIQIIDAGKYPLSSSCMVLITITDINDEIPTFPINPLTVELMENSETIPSYILQVSAIDNDSGSNGQLKYTIIGFYDTSLFLFEEDTGLLSVNKSLDRENESAYILTIEASDAGNPSLTGTGTLNIIVEDINDNEPIFEHNNYLIDIYEGLPIDTSVITVHAMDSDDGFNSQIRYELSSDVSGTFTIDPFSGLIVTTSILDFELNNIYQFNIIAWDRSITEPLFSTSEIKVNVLNSNDNPPAFLSKEVTVIIPTDPPAGTFVIGAQAIDLDGDSLIYSVIAGNDLNMFTIDSTTGVVVTKTTLGNEDNYILKIQVSDSLQFDEYSVIITFQDILNFPSFLQPIMTQFTYTENQSPITEITQLSARSSKPEDINSVSYYIAGGDIGNTFSIDNQSGKITLIGILDYESVDLYSIWVEAKDSDINPLSSYINLLINVTDENDEEPVFSEFVYYGIIREELENHPVITVLATDRDSGMNGELYYQLASTNSTNPLFSIDPSTGSLKTVNKLDRELTNNHLLTVYAIDKGISPLTGTASIEIAVEDINDNCMKVEVLSADIPENLPIGSYILTATYTDADEGSNAVAQFKFSPDGNSDETFILDSSGVLSLNSVLDYEIHDTYVLSVIAFDEFCSLNFDIAIFVSDINDNAPFFSSVLYEISMREKLSINTFIFNVSATDEDKGENGLIYYRLKTLTDMFGVDETSGSIFLKKELAYHSGEAPDANIYSLEILAIDHGIPSLYNDTKLLISIYEENVYPPIFDKTVYSTPIPLNAVLETKIIQVLAYETYDNGNNADIIFQISNGNGTNFFVIDAETGWIILSYSLEDSLDALYHLVIRAQDKGMPIQYTEVDVFFLITDENRYYPQFDSLYEFSIFENLTTSSKIATLLAFDDDMGVNGELSYFILEGNNENIFNLDVNNGVLSLVSALDYENIKTYILTVNCIDGGFYSKNTSTLVNIHVEDVNDNSPIFDTDVFNTIILENSMSGTHLLTVHAVDIDSSLYNDISYAIIGGSGKEHFSIDQYSGDITSQGTLDFEVNQEYQLTIWAGNKDTSFYGTAHVIVEIMDVNEYIPLFDKEEYIFNVSEDSPDTYYIGIIIAFDIDEGSKGDIFYYLVADSKEKGFSLDEKTGQLYISYVNGRLDREFEDKILLNVIAKNDGVIQGNDVDYSTIIIYVTDANDPPIFSQAIYELYNISEGIPLNSHIITLNADDYDVEISFHLFEYFINDTSFSIDSISGKVYSMKELDREMVPIYNFTVFAIDKGIPSQTGSASVLIYLLDVNDNGPYFTSENNIGYIFENEVPGTTVMTLIADDLDTTPNQGPFLFSILESEDSIYFNFSFSDLNVIQSTVSFDRESNNKYLLLIEGIDSGIPSVTSTSMITIEVLDKNDNPSSFRNSTIIIYAFNGIFSAGLIGTVHPNDPDVDDNFICEIIGSNSALFTIDSGCELYSSDHFGEELYQLEISGTDGKHSPSNSLFNIYYRSYDNTSLENSVSIHLANLTLDYFLNSTFFTFFEVFSSFIGTEDKLILLDAYSISESLLDLLLTIKKSDNTYWQRNDFTTLFTSIKDDLEKLTGIFITEIDINSCDSSPCLYGGTCSDTLEVHNEIILSNTEKNIFVRHKSIRVPICNCQNLYTGQFCEQPPDNCNENSCLNGGLCFNDLNTFFCECPEGTTGDNCEDINECELSSPCQNTGTCHNEVGHYKCECVMPYSGVNCESIIDFCDPPPCNGRECISKESNYTCQCCFGDQGVNCLEEATGFPELSFKQYKTSLAGSQNRISLQFSTFMENALLLYNHDNNEPANGESFSEFIALEVIDGSVMFSYALGATEGNIRIKTDKKVNDGMWHTVWIERIEAIGKLKIDECFDDEQPNYCKGEGSAGNLTTLDLDGMFMNLGGLSLIESITDRPGQVSTADFIGCMRDIFINDEELHSDSLIDSYGIELCPCEIGVCNSNPCLNNGNCIDKWYNYICECLDGYMGDNCEKESTSFSFGSNSHVIYTINEGYRRLQMIKDLMQSRKRREIVSATFSLKFRTRTESGLILTYSDQYYQFLVLIKQNTLHFTFGAKDFYTERLSEEPQPEAFIIHNKIVTDGIWYTLEIYLYNNVIDIIIEDDLSQPIHETHNFINYPPFLNFLVILELYVGGSIQSLYYEDELINGFSGCLDSFVVNEEKIPFSGVTEMIQAEPSTNVKEGCEGSNVCDSDPCQMNMLCIDEWEAYICTSAACESSPCKNNGTCTLVSKEIIQCACSPGFTGENCESLTCETYICEIEEECQETEEGNMCVALSPLLNNNNTVSIIVVVVIIACAFILIIVVVILIMIRKQKQNISHSKPKNLNDSSKRIGISGVSNTAYVSSEQVHKMNVQPDIIDTDTRYTSNNFQANNEAEYYPIETASIPPSDLDVPYYYKQYHKRDKISQPTYQNYGKSTSSIIAPLFVNNPDNPYLYTYSESTGSQHTPPSYMPFLQVSSQANSLTPISGLQKRFDNDNLMINNGMQVKKNSPILNELGSVESRPSSRLKSPLTIQEPPGLSEEEIRHLNTAPIDTNCDDSKTSLNAHSMAGDSSSCNIPNQDFERNVSPSSLLEPPESSTDDENDSFTCSEYEHDDIGEISTSITDPTSIIFGKLAQVENEVDDVNKDTHKNFRYEGLESASAGGSLSTLFASEDEGIKSKTGEHLSWDSLLNWGPSFENLVGVFTDIAQLQDSQIKHLHLEQFSSHEEYV